MNTTLFACVLTFFATWTLVLSLKQSDEVIDGMDKETRIVIVWLFGAFLVLSWIVFAKLIYPLWWGPS